MRNEQSERHTCSTSPPAPLPHRMAERVASDGALGTALRYLQKLKGKTKHGTSTLDPEDRRSNGLRIYDLRLMIYDWGISKHLSPAQRASQSAAPHPACGPLTRLCPQ